MKKLLSIGLVLTLVLSMSLVAFGTVQHEDWTEIKIDKEITAQGVNPTETFEFVVGDGTYVGEVAGVVAPEFDSHEFDIEILQGKAAGSYDLKLPEFSAVGVYTYPISEIDGNTAGFDYDVGPYNLKITVINDGQGGFIRVVTVTGGEGEESFKVDTFVNKFYAGDLVITKEITGNYAVFDDEFEVTVTLTPDAGKNIEEGPISLSGSVYDEGYSRVKNEDGTVTITFKVTNNSKVTIANIPYDVSYEVTENLEGTGYKATITDDGNGTISATSHLVAIVNTLETQIETGINLDNAPYILILAGVAVGLVGFTMKRRLSDDK